MKEKIKNLNPWKGLPTISKQEWSKLDWVVSMAILAVLFLVFMESDIIHTGNRSFLFYKDPLNFYKASYEQSQAFYANYLPSTFLAFAIWNLPLYLMGRVPAQIAQYALLNSLWYKLLPVALYFITAHFIYKIAVLMGFGEKKARLCKYAFILCPIAVYSQFIFSQYDIFTVFFIVVGFYFYLKGDLWKFALLFGIGATFKYQALAYFLILLVLKEKRFLKLIQYSVLALIPLAAEILPNLSSPYFYRCVFGFGALDAVKGGVEFGYFSSLSLAFALSAFLLTWAYTKRVEDQEEWFSWALFFTSGISFALFGFCRWHPQWLLILVPFFVLSVFRNQHGKVFMLILNIFMAAFYVFSVNEWEGIADHTMMNYGILKFLVDGKSYGTTMAGVYGYNNMQNLITCIWVIMLIYFVFNHPKNQVLKKEQTQQYMVNYIRVAFLVGVAAFALPALICLKSAVDGDKVYLDTYKLEENEEPEYISVPIYKDSTVTQTFEADTEVLTGISIRMGMYNRMNDSVLNVSIAEADTDQVVYEGEIDTMEFYKEESMYQLLDEPVDVKMGEMYELKLSSPAEGNNCVATYYEELTPEEAQEEDELAEIPDNKTPSQLTIKIAGTM